MHVNKLIYEWQCSLHTVICGRISFFIFYNITKLQREFQRDGDRGGSSNNAVRGGMQISMQQINILWCSVPCSDDHIKALSWHM
jgi:hypothetical protein